MFNPEKNFENKRESVDLSVEKIISSVNAEHVSIDRFKKMEGYSEKEVEEDKETLKSAEDYFERKESRLPKETKERLEKSQKRGEAMEIVLADLLDRWFETDDIEVITQRTTRFDDVVNGVDIIIEFKTSESIERTALAIDASLNISGMGDKLERCFKRVSGEEGDFQVKYFQGQFIDESGDYPHGPLETIVPMAVGLGYKNANNLFEDFADYLSARDMDFEKGLERMDELNSNSIKKIFLKQIENQLDFYKENDEEIDKKTLDEINKISTIIEEVSKEMDSVVCDLRQKDDEVLKETKNLKK